MLKKILIIGIMLFPSFVFANIKNNSMQNHLITNNSNVSYSVVKLTNTLGNENNIETYEYKSLNLETEPQKFDNCQSLFGDPKVKDPATPAYYISLLFSIIRYAAIILLLVLTTMDFVSAVASQDNDILKKTVNKTMKRAMLCVIIFFLPTLINFVLQIMHTSQISDCIDFSI